MGSLLREEYGSMGEINFLPSRSIRLLPVFPKADNLLSASHPNRAMPPVSLIDFVAWSKFSKYNDLNSHMNFVQHNVK